MTNFLKLDIPTFTDSRITSVIEDFLPFHVVRTYWIYGADGRHVEDIAMSIHGKH